MTQSLSKRTGYHILPDWRMKHFPMAEHLRTLFARYRIGLVLDVGANEGRYRDFLRLHVGYEGPIVSIEPIPARVADMQGRAGNDPNWQILGCALGREEGTQPFHVMKRDTFSSFLPPDVSEATAEVAGLNVVDRIEHVSVRRLDTLWPELRKRYGTVAPYLKLDTQGFDLEVIAGAESLLPEIPAIQSELAFQRDYVGAPDAQESLLSFAGLGYAVSGLFPITRDDRLAVRACDVTFVRRT